MAISKLAVAGLCLVGLRTAFIASRSVGGVSGPELQVGSSQAADFDASAFPEEFSAVSAAFRVLAGMALSAVLLVGAAPARADIEDVVIAVLCLAAMLSIALSSVQSFQAPAARVGAPALGAKMTAITPGDVGTTKPLGVYDPLGLMTKNPEKYRRFQEMEIKHGRFSMAACTHVFLTEAGIRWPGYLSFSEDIKFSDMPGGTIASWAALPGLAWLQIVLIVALFDNSVFAQKPEKAAGDVVPFAWVRYDDNPGFSGKEFKLNVERNNGRAAMMGISGMIIHEALTGNPVWPIPVPPQPVLEIVGDDVEKGPARVGAFVLASLGMAFAGIVAAIPELTKED